MFKILLFFVGAMLTSTESRSQLVAENLVLRQQLAVLKRSVKRPRLTTADRAFWAFVSRWWPRWREALVVPTATFGLLFGFVVLFHQRRRVVHFNVTSNPTAAWTAQQVVEAFPWHTAPRYMIRDRDRIYGADFVARVKGMGIHEVLTAPKSPWQNPYVERLIGSIRRDCLDHVVVLGEDHLRRILKSYFEYYHGFRTHLSLAKDSPDSREVDDADCGKVIALRKVGGLHHHYTRRAA